MKPAAGMQEVVEAVGESDKMRFGLKYQLKGSAVEDRGGGKEDDKVSKEMKGSVNGSATDEGVQGDGEDEVNGSAAITEEQSQTDTQRAVQIFTSDQDSDPTHFYIRANQGHSMKGVEAENLLVPITMENEASILGTVVHGTFYGAWESILKDGGLRRMGRNHIHFSTGPPLAEVLSSLDTTDGVGSGDGRKGRLSKLMDESKVVSGMRRDAQILIYVDMGKALRQEEGMKWWRSENGVVLTEGKGTEGKMETEYWTKVLEVKEGIGILWERDEDGQSRVVNELPTHLKVKAMPMGKSRGFGKADRGGQRAGGVKQRPDEP